MLVIQIQRDTRVSDFKTLMPALHNPNADGRCFIRIDSLDLAYIRNWKDLMRQSLTRESFPNSKYAGSWHIASSIP